MMASQHFTCPPPLEFMLEDAAAPSDAVAAPPSPRRSHRIRQATETRASARRQQDTAASAFIDVDDDDEKTGTDDDRKTNRQSADDDRKTNRQDDGEEVAVPTHPFFSGSTTGRAAKRTSRKATATKTAKPDKAKRPQKRAKSSRARAQLLSDDDNDNDSDNDQDAEASADSTDAPFLLEQQRLREAIERSKREAEELFNGLPINPFFTLSAKQRSFTDVPSVRIFNLPDFPLAEHIPSPILPSSFESIKSESIPIESIPIESIPIESIPIESIPIESIKSESIKSESIKSEAIPIESIAVESIPDNDSYIVIDDTDNSATAAQQQVWSRVLPAIPARLAGQLVQSLGSAQQQWPRLVVEQLHADSEASELISEASVVEACQRLAELDASRPKAAKCWLWTDRFRPASSETCLVSERVRSRVYKTLSGSGSSQCRHALLVGPVGCGKTTVVYAAAAQLDLHVIELHAGELRNAARLHTCIEEATQSSSVVAQSAVILLEDIDQIFAADKGLVPALNALLGNAKRPVVMTSSTAGFTGASIGLDHSQYKLVHCRPCDARLAAFQALAICNQAMTDRAERPHYRHVVAAVLHPHKPRLDMRRLIHAVQLHCCGPADLLPHWRELPARLLGLPEPLAALPLAALQRALADNADGALLHHQLVVDAAPYMAGWDPLFETYPLASDVSVAAASDVCAVLSSADLLAVQYAEPGSFAHAFARSDDADFGDYYTEPDYRTAGRWLAVTQLARLPPVAASLPSALDQHCAVQRRVPKQKWPAMGNALASLVPAVRIPELRAGLGVDYAATTREIIVVDEEKSKLSGRRRYFYYLAERVDDMPAMLRKLGGAFSDCPDSDAI